MQQLSNKETALLGLLSEGPMHPYRVQQEINNRSMREWTEISVSSIYKILAKLEKESLIKSKLNVNQNNISQKIYYITTKGRQAYEASLLAILSEPEKMLYRIDLATSHLGNISHQKALEALKGYREKLASGLKCYKELEKYLADSGCAWYSRALAVRPQYLAKAEIEWVDSYIKELQTRK